MAQTTNFNSNSTENGWIYKNFVERMNKLSSDMKVMQNMLEVANSELNISMKDYNTLIKSLSSKIDSNEFNDHSRNHNIHVDETEKANWSNKLDLRDVKNIEVSSDKTEIKVNMKRNNEFFIIPIKFL